MATVFLADDGTGHDVAIKIFQEGPGVSPTMLERFRREAEATKKLRRHPNIMKVYATGKQGPWHYIVMEPIRNSRTLEDALESTPMTIEEVVRVILKIARALHYAHSRNIIHRDVKPANIMVDEFGEPRLSDFGVAELEDMPGVTITGALTGTPLYMSPEQARADKVEPTSDIYSLGVVLYEALTGVLPYTTQHAAPVRSVLEAVRNEMPKRPRFHRKEISKDLEAVVLKAIEKDPAKRYADAEAFANDLERAISGRRVSARLFSYWEYARTLSRRYDQFFAAAMVMMLMGCMAAVFIHQQMLRERYNKLTTDLHYRKLMKTEKTSGESAERLTGAYQMIRDARRGMADFNNLTPVFFSLREAAKMCQSANDQRTLATVNIELARCETLNGHFKDAREIYLGILNVDDAKKSDKDTAQLEALELAILDMDRTKAAQIVNMHKLPDDAAKLDIIRCLSFEIDAAKLVSTIKNYSDHQRTAVYFAAAIRYHYDGQEHEFARLLERCTQPSSEWPAPFAKKLRMELKR